MDLKRYVPAGAGIFTFWVANGQLEAFTARFQEVCSQIDPTGAYGQCGYDTSLLFFSCVLSGVGVGMLTHYFVVQEHQ